MTYFERSLGAIPISRLQIIVKILRLAALKDRATISEITAHCGAPRSAVRRTVALLDDRGYLARADSDDRREQPITLSETGHQAAQAWLQYLDGWIEQLSR